MPNFLCLDGPFNGLYASLAEAYEAGYEAPSATDAKLWGYEPVLVFPQPA